MSSLYTIHQKCKLKEDHLTFGALCVLKHLLPRCISLSLVSITYVFIQSLFPISMMLHFVRRLLEAWHSKRPLLIEAARSLLDEQSLAVRKALSEVLSWHIMLYFNSNICMLQHDLLSSALIQLIVVMASHCYLVGPSGELFVEYLVRHSAIGEIDNLKVTP